MANSEQNPQESPHGHAGGQPSPLSNARWLMIGFAFLATVINYLDRQTLSVVAPLLSQKFQMSSETYGLILAAFMFAYTVMNGVSGPLLDRLGTRLGYALCVAWWSTAAVLHGLARGPWSLGLFRFLLGMGEAGNWPAAVKVVAEWFPAGERSLASGIFNSGAAIGAIAAPPLVVAVVHYAGWQAAFVAVGLTGYMWVLAWWLIYDTPAHVRREVQAPPAPPWRLLRTRFLASLTLSKIFLDPVWYFYIFWFPKYLSSVHGLSMASIGKTGWIPFVTADLGNLVGGWLAGVLIRGGLSVSAARKTIVTLSAVLMTAAIPAAFSTTVTHAILLVSLATFGYTSYNANALAFPADVFPRNMVGSIWGLASLGAGVGGMLFSWLSGRVIDAYGYTPVFVGCGIMPLIAAAIVLCFLGPLRPLPEFHGAPPGNDATGTGHNPKGKS
jgi:ACS family hexuronate transporter-like MFS transporter